MKNEIEFKKINTESNSDIALKKMIKISIICLLFLFAELIGGLIANSLAILTDAAHLSSDLSGFIISILAIYIGKKKPNKKYNFGYYRAEVLGALLSVVTIWILTGVLLKEAVDRFVNPTAINAPVMLLTAILGLICNIAMMKVLHSGPGGCGHGHSHGNGHDHSHIFNLNTTDSQDDISSSNDKRNSELMITVNPENNTDSHSECNGHSHSHSHSHQHSHSHSDSDCHGHGHEDNEKSKKGVHYHNHDDHSHSHENNDFEHDDVVTTYHHEENVNIKAAIIHIIGDIIQSVGVVIASLLIYFKPEYIIVDPICTFVFSIIVLFTTINITKQCINVLMEASPKNIDIDAINKKLKIKFSYIKSIHEMKVWSLGSGKNCISMHIVIDKNNKETSLKKIKDYLNNFNKFEYSTIQLETEDEERQLLCNI